MILQTALLHNSEIRFLMISLCFHITNFESIFHRLELNVAYNYEKIELCNKAITNNIILKSKFVESEFIILSNIITDNYQDNTFLKKFKILARNFKIIIYIE